MESAFIVVQVLIFVFLLVHDWISLGPLNDLGRSSSDSAFSEHRQYGGQLCARWTGPSAHPDLSGPPIWRPSGSFW